MGLVVHAAHSTHAAAPRDKDASHRCSALEYGADNLRRIDDAPGACLHNLPSKH